MPTPTPPHSTISLEQQAADDHLTVSERIAISDAETRKKFAETLLGTFIKVNIFTVIIVGALFIADVYFLNINSTYTRIIDSKFLMAFLGADLRPENSSKFG